MVDVATIREIKASAQDIWVILGNFGDMSWVPGATDVEVIGSGVGMIRRLHMTGIDPIDEQLESFDEDKFTYQYSIPKNAVIPFEDYLATVTVKPNSTGGSTVSWSCSFQTSGMSDADARQLMESSYNMMLDGLTHRLGI